MVESHDTTKALKKGFTLKLGSQVPLYTLELGSPPPLFPDDTKNTADSTEGHNKILRTTNDAVFESRMANENSMAPSFLPKNILETASHSQLNDENYKPSSPSSSLFTGDNLLEQGRMKLNSYNRITNSTNDILNSETTEGKHMKNKLNPTERRSSLTTDTSLATNEDFSFTFLSNSKFQYDRRISSSTIMVEPEPIELFDCIDDFMCLVEDDIENEQEAALLNYLHAFLSRYSRWFAKKRSVSLCFEASSKFGSVVMSSEGVGFLTKETSKLEHSFARALAATVVDSVEPEFSNCTEPIKEKAISIVADEYLSHSADKKIMNAARSRLLKRKQSKTQDDQEINPSNVDNISHSKGVTRPIISSLNGAPSSPVPLQSNRGRPLVLPLKPRSSSNVYNNATKPAARGDSDIPLKIATNNEIKIGMPTKPAVLAKKYKERKDSRVNMIGSIVNNRPINQPSTPEVSLPSITPTPIFTSTGMSIPLKVPSEDESRLLETQERTTGRYKC